MKVREVAWSSIEYKKEALTHWYGQFYVGVRIPRNIVPIRPPEVVMQLRSAKVEAAVTRFMMRSGG